MKDTIKSLQPKLEEIFNHLHTHAEISWEEYNTTQYIQDLLAPYDCKITTFDTITGLVVDVGQGKPVIGLRADIDALWQDVNGTFQANHSCGHDAHMTIAIGTFLTIMEMGIPSTGTFRFIFQPAEEKGAGALAFVEKGVVDDVDFLYGMHLRPIQELSNGYFSPVIENGASRLITGIIEGEDAHGARPHLNANAIQVATDIFQQINNIQMNALIPHSAKMTELHAGGKSVNIIPGNATFSIDIRAQTNELLANIMSHVEKIVAMFADYYKIKISLDPSIPTAAAVINEEAIGIMREAIIECVGKDKLGPNIRTTGGDDFHSYTIKKPHIKATMLGIGCDLKPGLHHPHMKFDNRAIPIAIEVITKALLKTVEKQALENVSKPTGG